jgi:predicted acetyltransferase
MNVTITKASSENARVLENLMQFYIYDFSEFVDLDVRDDGLFEPYSGLQSYWDNQSEKFPYFINEGDILLGFVLVRRITEGDKSYFSMAEFFIMRKYRRKGIGRSIAEQVFQLHKGRWEIYQKESNKPAQAFWRNVISKCTGGRFKERTDNGKRIQEFEI